MDDLRGPTLATLAEIQRFPWCTKVGTRDVKAAVQLDDWFQAISSVESEEWEGLCLDAINGYCEKLSKVAPLRFKYWNMKVEAIKRTTVPLIAALFVRPDLRSLPKIVHDTTQWDVLHVCMEAEFSDCL